jgi:hypothetical protein
LLNHSVKISKFLEAPNVSCLIPQGIHARERDERERKRERERERERERFSPLSFSILNALTSQTKTICASVEKIKIKMKMKKYFLSDLTD